MIFRLYAVYDKKEMIKIGKQTRENSQVLEQFCCRLHHKSLNFSFLEENSIFFSIHSRD